MNICHPYFDKFLIGDSYASRPGKGVHAGITKAKKYTQTGRWFLKLDVKKFFASVHHDVLKEQLARRFKDPQLLGIFDQIIDSYENEPNRGLPIGNLASQYFANHYLGELDHFIKEKLKCKYYVRYMDDMVIWTYDKEKLKQVRQDIDGFIQTQLKCQLKPILLNTVERGVPFCGYIIRPNYIRLSQRSKQRYIRKMNILQEKYDNGEWTPKECQQKALPLIAFTQFAETKAFRQKVLLKI